MIATAAILFLVGCWLNHFFIFSMGFLKSIKADDLLTPATLEKRHRALADKAPLNTSTTAPPALRSFGERDDVRIRKGR